MSDNTPRSRARSAAAHNDTDSVRRIGEALLMAQNRARVSTERANRSERILRTVLSQINLQSGVLLHELEEYPRTMSFDSLEDWSLLRSLVEPPRLHEPDLRPLQYPAPPSPRGSAPTERTSFALSMADTRATSDTLSTSRPHDDATTDIRMAARDVVLNLHVAARLAEQRIQKMNKNMKLQDPTPSTRLSIHGWLARMLGVETYYYARPWQFMVGVVLGFALGVVTTRRLILEQTMRPVAKGSVSPTKYPSALLMDQPTLVASGTTPGTMGRMTCRSDALSQRQMTRLHLAASRLPVTFAMEDMSYLLHPPTEVS